jgi:hypothetical protein
VGCRDGRAAAAMPGVAAPPRKAAMSGLPCLPLVLGSAEEISQRSRAAVPLFLAGVGHVPPGPRRSHPSGGGTRVRCREWMVEARRRPARAEVGSGHFASGAARLTVSHDPEEG